MASILNSSIRKMLLLSACALAFAATTSAAETVEPIEVMYAVDPVVELPIEVEVAIDEPADIAEVEVVVEDPTDTTEVEVAVEEPADTLEDNVVESYNEVPIEWMLRDFEPGIMYSAMGGAGLEDNADEIASRAAEQAANRTIDNIETTLPDAPPQP